MSHAVKIVLFLHYHVSFVGAVLVLDGKAFK